MSRYKTLEFIPLAESDVEELTPMMARAFDEDARRHLGEEHGGPPGYDNGDFLRRWYLHVEVDSYKILRDGIVIGAVNAVPNPDGVYYLGNVFIEPALQDQGIGTLVWEFLLQRYPEAQIWRTDTPGFSKRNHHFYVNKCGFHIVQIHHPGDRLEESYILEKRMTVSTEAS
ncbi:GNAT family N-acetyltransferase [Gorillibacterium sp. sgz500922]|uniref:GNAT family N-acetyltransferase n=1 Tax=Gorillibacterium sp. sgz500922 TaxID=3446694 RepID=UPI003F6746D2